MKLLSVLEATTSHFTKHGLPSPRLQAELLIAHALSLPRLGLYLQFERELTAPELELLRPLVRRRAKASGMAPVPVPTSRTSPAGWWARMRAACSTSSSVSGRGTRAAERQRRVKPEKEVVPVMCWMGSRAARRRTRGRRISNSGAVSSPSTWTLFRPQ